MIWFAWSGPARAGALDGITILAESDRDVLVRAPVFAGRHAARFTATAPAPGMVTSKAHVRYVQGWFIARDDL